MAHHAVRGAGHRVRPHQQRCVAARLKWLNVAAPGMAEDVARAAFKLFWYQALEAVATARAMAIYDDDVIGARRLRSAHRGVDLARHKPAPLVVLRRAARHLLPDLDAGDAFHIYPDYNAHV